MVAVIADRLTRFILARIAVRVTRLEGVRIGKEVLLSFQRPAGIFAGVGLFEFLLPVLGIDAGVLSIPVSYTHLTLPTILLV